MTGQLRDPIWADCFGLIAPSPMSLKVGGNTCGVGVYVGGQE